MPLLVCGVAGVAGYNALHHFRSRYGDAVYGQRPTRNWPLRGHGIIGCDLEDVDSFRNLIREKQVRTIVNSGGSCALKACELDPEMANRVNTFCVGQMLDAIEGTDIRLVHLSIDLVFSGDGDGGYVETDVPDPVTVYGKTMVAAEQLILSRRPGLVHLANFITDGRQFQWARRRD